MCIWETCAWDVYVVKDSMSPYESRLTGPITASSVTSKVFSIGALLKSSGGGLIRVGRGASFDSSSDFPILLKFINDDEME